MKIKVFTSMMEGNLERKVNSFIQDVTIEVKDIKYSASIFYMSVCIVYIRK
jgi:hypothetical protein